MQFRRYAPWAVILTLGLAVGDKALAQKSADQLRIAVAEPFKSMLPYEYTQTEASPFYYRIYESLVQFDEHERKFVPDLARSWKRLSDTVIEFELRDGVKFHNGNQLGADDVVHTLNWAADRNVKILFKERYTWVKDVEKLGPLNVRITTDGIYATDLMSLALRMYILDSKTHKQDPAEYGRKGPVGTGPYKVSLVDSNRGTIVERFEGYKPTEAARRAPIRRIHAVPTPDAQSQIAKLLVGDVDVIRDLSPENAADLEKNPELNVTPIDSQTLIFFGLDAAGRSGRTEFKDARVRKALMMAINRDSIVDNFISGGRVATRVNAMCFKSIVGCDHSIEPVGYDPAAARKLLAEAGYPNGLDIKLMGHTSVRSISEAIAGDLHKIGVRATVQSLTITVLRNKRGDGELEGYVGYFPNTVPDSLEAMAVFFEGNRDYTNDSIIVQGVDAGKSTHDEQARYAAYKKVYDRINAEHYMLPISSRPFVYAHSKDVRIEPSQLSSTMVTIGDFFWK